MVTKKQAAAKQPYRPACRDDNGWLCNVVDNCTTPAVIQASPDVLPLCSGCDTAGGEMKANLEKRQAQLASVDSRHDAITAAAQSRRDGPANIPLDLLDQLELYAIAERRRLLGAEIEGLAAAHARVVAEHTHPLFACAKHASNLPN